MTKIIYDIGANNGDDIEYYGLKADLVVAVEANPILADAIKTKYASLVLKNKLIVENCVVTAGEEGVVNFYIHKLSHVQSQFPPPPSKDLHKFNQVQIESKSLKTLLSQYGHPYYIKIDIEHMDQVILKSLFQHGVVPEYLSAECHSLEVALLLCQRYRSFKIVSGPFVDCQYKSVQVKSLTGEKITVSFQRHSAGPFGDDIKGQWMAEAVFLRKLAIEGLGWVDVHCSNHDEPKYLYMSNMIFLLLVAKGFMRSVLSAKHIRRFLIKVKLYRVLILLFM